ncbi:MAG: four helix bundle protein [Candidatus Marinimicrobia bacterium]|nr:four helix bundle protein [Candidatus Neomarinimicrobiota bacterium]
MERNLILDKSIQFAIKIIKAYQYLKNDRKEYVMSKQLLKSGTSIGANMKEAIQAQSKRDFLSKTNIALKEASETEYWIDILMKTGYFNERQNSLMADCIEINKILQSIVKTTKNNLNMV